MASDINAKSYAIDAAKRAVSDHLKTNGIYNTTITSSRAFETIFRLHYEVIGEPLVSILVEDDTEECIAAINKWNTYKNIEIIKASDYSESIKELNKAALRNYLATKAKGEYLLFLNGHVNMTSPEFVKELLSLVQRKDVGAAGGMLINSSGKIEHAGIVLGIGKDRAAGLVHYGFDKKYIGYMGRLCYIQDVSAVVSDMLMVKASDFLKVQGFDSNYTIGFSDVAFCLKLRRLGLLNIFNPYAVGICDRGQILLGSEDDFYKKDLSRFLDEFESEIKSGDPYYNVNLTRDSLDYSIM